MVFVLRNNRVKKIKTTLLEFFFFYQSAEKTDIGSNPLYAFCQSSRSSLGAAVQTAAGLETLQRERESARESERERVSEREDE